MFGKLFSKSSLGIEIGDDSIKFIELVVDKDSLKVKRYKERPLHFGVASLNEVKNSKQMEKILLAFRKEEGIKSAYVSLPNTEIKNKKEYLSIFNKSVIKVQSFESETQAITRAVVKKNDMGTYMVVDFGSTRTLIFIVSSDNVVFTFTSGVSGETLSEMIQKKLNIGPEEAEKTIERHGLHYGGGENKIFKAILDSVSLLREEIEKHFLSWHIYKDKGGKNNPLIKKIILCGSESSLPGLSEYLSVSMKSKVEMANVWVNVLDTKKKIPEISFKQSLGLATVIGVALKDF